MILKLGMKHQGEELYRIYINHDPGMTLTFFYGKVNLGHQSRFLNEKKTRKMSFNGRTLARNDQMDRKFMFLKIFWAQGVVCPSPGLCTRI